MPGWLLFDLDRAWIFDCKYSRTRTIFNCLYVKRRHCVNQELVLAESRIGVIESRLRNEFKFLSRWRNVLDY